MKTAYFREDYNHIFSLGPLSYIDKSINKKSTIKKIRWDSVLPLDKKTTRLDREYEDSDAEYRIYGWIDDYDVVLYTNACRAMLTDESTCMFREMEQCEEIDLGPISFSQITNAAHMFAKCHKLEKIIGEIDLSNGRIAECMFADCHVLKEIEIYAECLENAYKMFYNCWDLVTIYGSLQFGKRTQMIATSMFENCESLEYARLASLGKISEAIRMFKGCSNIGKHLVLQIALDRLKADEIFAYCTKLKQSPTQNITLGTIVSGKNAFKGCVNINGFIPYKTSIDYCRIYE